MDQTHDQTAAKAEVRLKAAKERREAVLLDLAKVNTEIEVLEDLLGLTGKGKGRHRSTSDEVIKRLRGMVRYLGGGIPPAGPKEIAAGVSKNGLALSRGDVADTLRRKAMYFTSPARGKWQLSEAGKALYKEVVAELKATGSQ